VAEAQLQKSYHFIEDGAILRCGTGPNSNFRQSPYKDFKKGTGFFPDSTNSCIIPSQGFFFKGVSALVRNIGFKSYKWSKRSLGSPNMALHIVLRSLSRWSGNKKFSGAGA
jgi:hypothetical protein